MSRYHPLDVRHPANRDLLNRNYLLDPPARRPRTASERPATGSAPRSRTPGARQVSAPWSSPPSSSSGTTARRGAGLAGFLRTLVIIGVVIAVLAQQTDLLDPLILQVRIWAFDMGLPLPF